MHERRGVGDGGDGERARVGAAGEEVGVDVVEAHECRGRAPVAEARGHGRDAVERVEFLGEREREEARVVAGHERAHGVGAEAERAQQARRLRVGERAVEVRRARHGVGHLEGQDAHPAVARGRRLGAALGDVVAMESTLCTSGSATMPPALSSSVQFRKSRKT